MFLFSAGTVVKSCVLRTLNLMQYVGGLQMCPIFGIALALGLHRNLALKFSAPRDVGLVCGALRRVLSDSESAGGVFGNFSRRFE